MAWCCTTRKRPRRVYFEPIPLKKEGQERTLWLEEQWNSKTGNSKSQLQSRLMRLPFEIRHQIWQYCLGGSTIELKTYLHNYWRGREAPRGLLSVALSCRQMYCETIDILYERNSFSLGMGKDSGLYLHLLVPLRRIQKIRDMSLRWSLREPPANGSPGHRRWIAFWQAMTLFTGLQKLRVEIKVALVWKFDWISEETRLFENIQRAVLPVDSTLVLCWPSSSRGADLPCKILRIDSEEL
ncbi:hypothetical protein N431DRAFT_212296 [Stipitochalara longipes BDJ]|nr:hypothetical protein N431DRAFT_212296 [Stipitochalara longipes BDJ]